MNNITRVPNLVFRCFYTHLQQPEKPDAPRTFIADPPEDKKQYFEAAEASASDPIRAHTGMFDPKTNTNCYALGISTASLITEMVHRFEQWRDSQQTDA
jgi:hypothetical protein